MGEREDFYGENSDDEFLRVSTPALSVGRVHLWLARTYLLPSAIVRKYASYVDSETWTDSKASGRRAEVARREAISHGLVRTLLASYGRCHPADLRFSSRCVVCGSVDHGKPRISPAVTSDLAELSFNISHSGDAVAIAVARGVEVGVDIECLRTNVDWPTLQSRVFTPAEQDFVASLGSSPRVYCGLWTRKEAVLKATGHGLSAGLASVEVIPTSGGLMGDRDDGGWQPVEFSHHKEQHRCWVASVTAWPDYATAVAALRQPSGVDVIFAEDKISETY